MDGLSLIVRSQPYTTPGQIGQNSGVGKRCSTSAALDRGGASGGRCSSFNLCALRQRAPALCAVGLV